MRLSTTPYVEDFKRHLGAVSVAPHPEGYQIGGFGLNAYIIVSAEELLSTIELCSKNSGAFSVFCQAHPDWNARTTPPKVVRTTEPLSLSDLGL